MTESNEKSRYVEVNTRIWIDADFRSLSRPQPNAQSLFTYLLTNPRSTALPGVLCLGLAAASEELEWLPERFRERFAELEANGMARSDWDARLVFLPNALKRRPPANPNVVKSWGRLWDEVPECPLKLEIYEALSQVKKRGKGFAEAFAQSVPKPLGKPFPKVSPNQYLYLELDQQLSVSERASAPPTLPVLGALPQPLSLPAPSEAEPPTAASVPGVVNPMAPGPTAQPPQDPIATPGTESVRTKAPSKADSRAAPPPSVDEEVWAGEGLALTTDERREVARVHSMILLGFRARWEPLRATIWPGPQGRDAKALACAIMKTAAMNGMDAETIVQSALDQWFSDSFVKSKRYPWPMCRTQLLDHWKPPQKPEDEAFDDPGVNTLPDELIH